jgi:hypothetical protein
MKGLGKSRLEVLLRVCSHERRNIVPFAYWLKAPQSVDPLADLLAEVGRASQEPYKGPSAGTVSNVPAVIESKALLTSSISDERSS